jgi:Leucine-rich repeat (LRR) protein
MQVASSISCQSTAPFCFLHGDRNNPSSLLLPLHGYHQYQQPIATPAPAIDMMAGQAYLMPELIEMIQGFCLPQELLTLTSINKAAFATRFHNPSLAHLYFTTSVQVEAFLLSCCQPQTAEFTSAIRLRTDFQNIKALTLHLSDQLTVKQVEKLFAYLPSVTHLKIRLAANQRLASLGPLCKAAHHLPLTYLKISRGIDNKTPGREDALPSELWQWPTLEELYLCALDNVCSISEGIGKLINLTSLHLKTAYLEVNDELITLPESLGQLTKLETLVIEGFSALRTLPEAIGHLTALKALRLRHLKGFAELPTSLWQLKELKALIIANSGINQIPNAINQLTALTSLSLRNLRALTALPAGLWQLNSLEALELYLLPCIDKIPELTRQFTALKSLELVHLEALTVLPTNLWQLNKLELLTLEHLPLISKISEEISHLQSLRHLKLAGMPLLSVLPLGLWQLSKLETLYLVYIPLHNIPEELGQLSALTLLELEQMYSVKTLPQSLGQLQKLEMLKLAGLANIEALPETIAQLTALKTLHLGELYSLNSLPENLAQLKQLQKIIVEENPPMFDVPTAVQQYICHRIDYLWGSITYAAN